MTSSNAGQIAPDHQREHQENKVKKVELLAPVGKWDVLEAVISAGADAVYLGGKKFNMRLHRKDYNFTEEELRDAVKFAHERGVKVYVTVNNMLTNSETAELPDYLTFLEEIGTDALIIQDLGVVQLVRKLGLKIPLHSSVMMNAHSKEGLAFLKELGITRVILGRELSLSEIKLLHSQVPIELEYFVHGDMCFCQSAQCYHSGMVFGKSSNRGRCLKPCRWPYEFVDRETGKVLETKAPGPYFLAVKDMCLLPYLPEVIDAGICSLKVEGRMRTADYLKPLISFYRRALDRFYADPVGYTFDWDEFRELQERRVRDLSPMFAFGNPGPASIGYTGEREPRFFSQAVEEPVIKEKDLNNNPFPKATASCSRKPLLAAKVGSLEAGLKALESGVEVLYTSGESFLCHRRRWQLEDYRELVARGRELGAKVIIGLPRITMPGEMERVNLLLREIEKIEPDGILVTNLGTIYAAAKLTALPLYADYSSNIANKEAAELLVEYRLVQVTVPIELCYEEYLNLLQDFPVQVEAVVHGTLPAMVSDHCLPAALLEGTTRYQICSAPCRRASFGLRDRVGQIHPVEIDFDCRNHLFLAHELALLPYLEAVASAGFQSLRLEIPTYNPQEVQEVVALYRKNLDQLATDPSYRFSKEDWKRLQKARKATYGTGPYTHGVKAPEG